MNYNYRSGGSWTSPTVKRRENGAWVTVGGGDGGGGGGGSSGGGTVDDGWVDPPTRSNEVFHSNLSSSTIEGAIEEVDPDTKLILDQGPYSSVDASTISQSVHEVTVSGGDSRASIDGASGTYTFHIDKNWVGNSADPVSAGDTTISVSDASAFTVGNLARVYDPNHIYRGIDSNWSSDSVDEMQQGQLTVIDSIDTSANTVDVWPPIQLDFPDDSGTLVFEENSPTPYSLVFERLDLSGSGDTGSGERGFVLRGVLDLWYVDCTFDSYDRDCIRVDQSHRVYGQDLSFADTHHYGLNFTRASRHGRFRRFDGQNQPRYVLASGGSGDFAPSYDLKGDTIEGTNVAAVCDSHHGQHTAEMTNITANDGASQPTELYRMRGVDLTLDGGTWNLSDTSTDSRAVRIHQFPYNKIVKNVTGGPGSSADAEGFDFTEVGDAPSEEEPIDLGTLEIVDCDMTGDSAFEFTTGNTTQFSLHIIVNNFQWNGEQVDGTHIESASGYDTHEITYEIR